MGFAGQRRGPLRCLAQAGPAAAPAGALAEQDGARGLERLHRRRAHGLQNHFSGNGEKHLGFSQECLGAADCQLLAPIMPAAV